eukprot:TRINITY_DN46576_c0_g1_i1.p1 TRINITY_DN46576_c0_g1~~TRINITY_DN46576_c0_g1_i1.p1  ORF type:complete len:2016 (-),score=547.01 TRINITY_DN46576_c0_g1_i1:14-6061(-)
MAAVYGHTASDGIPLPITHLSLEVMEWLVEEGCLKPTWKDIKHEHLDFSDPTVFKLERFQPLDFQFGGPQLKGAPDRDFDKTYMNVGSVRTLNLDNNLLDDRLSETESHTTGLSGVLFYHLLTLRLKNNRLCYPVLLLPKLKELNLSHNQIRNILPLSGMPNLEVLNLSYNRIDAVDKAHFSGGSGARLRTLDLSQNDMQQKPTELYEMLGNLENLQNLTHLCLQGNPFCNYFSEYQPLVAYKLPRLHRLDDVPLKDKAVRQEFLDLADTYFRLGDPMTAEEKDQLETMSNGSDLGPAIIRMLKFDETASRRKTLDSSHALAEVHDTAAAKKTSEPEELPPQLKDMVWELEQALIGYTNVANSVSHVFAMAARVSTLPAEQHELMFIPFEKGSKAANQAKNEDLVASFVQQMELMFERDATTRILLCRILARYANVACFGMGAACLGTMAAFARSDPEQCKVVAAVASELVIPHLTRMSTDNPAFKTVMCGVAALCPYLGEELHEILQPAVGRLAECAVERLRALNCSSRVPEEEGITRQALVTIIRHASDDLAAASLMVEDSSANFVVTLGQALAPHDLEDSRWDTFVEVATTMRNLCKYSLDVVLDTLKVAQLALHVTWKDMLVTNLIGVPMEPLLNNVPLCKKMGSLIDIITDMMEEPRIREDLCQLHPGQTAADNQFVQVLLKCSATGLVDPVLLAAAMRCMTVILREEKHLRDRYAPVISEALNMTNDLIIVLPFLAERGFAEICRRADAHMNLPPGDSAEGAKPMPVLVAKQGFNTCSNPVAHNVLIHILGFIGLWEEFDEDNPLCNEVSENLNSNGREQHVFHVMEVPSSAVQAAALRCIGQTDIDDLDEKEMNILINMLDPNTVAHEEQLYCHVLTRLRMFLTGDGDGAAKFRAMCGEAVCERTFQVLSANVGRATFGNIAEEQQKYALSMQAVAVLRSAGEFVQLRPILRGPEVGDRLQQVLKFEQAHSQEGLDDISLELTWSGRSVEYLLSCIGGADALSPEYKQGFRVCHRIADVLCGVPDQSDGLTPSAYDRAIHESKMWNDKEIRFGAAFLDDLLFEDRKKQHQVFCEFKGVEQMIFFLESQINGLAAESAALLPSAGAAADEGSLAREIRKIKQRMVERPMRYCKNAEGFLAHMRRHAKFMAKFKHAAHKKKCEKEDPEEVDIAGDGTFLEQDGLSVMKNVFMSSNTDPYPTERATNHTLFLTAVPLRLRQTEYFLKPGGSGKIMPSYAFVAMLRAFYAMLLMPAVERFRSDVRKCLLLPSFYIRVLALTEICGSLLNCNVASKIMRIMTSVLQKPPGTGYVEGDTYVICLCMASHYAGYCLTLVAPLLEGFQQRERHLTAEQLALVSEAARLLRTIAEALCCIKGSFHEEVQNDVLEETLRFALPKHLVEALFLCLSYDMQNSVGHHHGNDISENFGKGGGDCRGLTELVSETLSFILDACPHTRYDIKELFASLETLHRHNVRDSMVADLMRRVHLLKYKKSFQDMLSVPELETGLCEYEDERIVRVIEVELPMKGLSVIKPGEPLNPRIMVMTTKRLLVFAPPVHQHFNQPCGSCPPHGFCPIGPTCEQIREYKDLTRIVCGYDGQMFILGWIADPNAPKITEDLQYIVCHRSDVRRYFVNALSALSGVDYDSRVPVSLDDNIPSNLKLKTKTAAQPICCSYAIRHDKSLGVGATGAQMISFFVLTETDFFEFEVDWKEWVPPSAIIPFLGGDEEYSVNTHSGEGQEMYQDVLAKFRSYARSKIAYELPSSGWFGDGDAAAEKTKKGAAADGLWPLDAEDPEELEKALHGKRGHGHGRGHHGHGHHGHVGHGHDGHGHGEKGAKNKELTPEERAAKRKEAIAKAMHCRALALDNTLTGLAAPIEKAQGCSETVALRLVRHKAKSSMLKLVTQKSLADLSGIDFEPEEDPLLVLHFGETTNWLGQKQQDSVAIRFLDDVARERWRRSLAFALTLEHQSINWHRLFKEHEHESSAFGLEVALFSTVTDITDKNLIERAAL